MTVQKVKESIGLSIETKTKLIESNALLEQISSLAEKCTLALKNDGKIIFCGNIINNILVFYRNNIELYLILLLNIGFILYIFNLKLLNIKNINIIFGLIIIFVKKMIV